MALGDVKSISTGQGFVMNSNGGFTPLSEARAAAGKIYRGYQSGANLNIANMIDAANEGSSGVNDAYNMFNVSGAYNDYLSSIDQFNPESLRSRAAADVQQGYGNAWGQYERDLSRQGIDPTSGRYGSTKAMWERAMAAALAGAKSKASFDGLSQRTSLLGNAAQIGGQLATGMASNKLNAAQLKVNANQTAADYNSSQAAGAAQLAGWSSIL